MTEKQCASFPVSDAQCRHVGVNTVGDDAVEDVVPAELRRGLSQRLLAFMPKPFMALLSYGGQVKLNIKLR